jgi:predicted rRNA methylase YqxC with S4 and FtsJ domains
VKLIAALGYFGFDPTAKACLDIGATTGGFTQVLLERGDRLDDAVDAGRAQLYGTFRAWCEIVSLEETNIRTLSPPRRAAQSHHRRCQPYFAQAGIAGGDGNAEFLLGAARD